MVDLAVALEAAPKALVYAAVMLGVGAATGRGLLRFRVAPRLTVAQRFALADGFRRLAVIASMVLVAALTWRAWAHTAAAFGISESFSPQNLYTIAIESQWGSGWQLQMAAALVLAAVSRTISRWPAAGWRATAVVAVALCYLLPLVGHAAGEPGRALLHGSHILAAGSWVGTLAAMTLASRAHDLAPLAAPPLPSPRQEMLSQFSPVALPGSALLLVTGATAAWLYLGGWSALWTSTYGQLLLVKLFLAAAVAGCGFVNWQTLRHPDRSSELPWAGRLLVGLELVLAVGVVIVTAVLTETEHP